MSSAEEENGAAPERSSNGAGAVRKRRGGKAEQNARSSDSASSWSTEGSDTDQRRREAKTRRRRRPSKHDSRTRAHTSRSSKPPTPRKAARSSTRKEADSDQLFSRIGAFLWALGSFFGEVLGRTAHMLKTPIAFLCMVAVLFVALYIATRWVTGAICALPGSSYVFSRCAAGEQPTSIQEIQRLVWTHEELDRIQELAAGGASLPLFIKRGESAIREVSKRVELSELPSRHALVPLFSDFHQRARNAGTDIQRFYSHLGRTYDRAIGITIMTSRKLEELQAVEAPSGSGGSGGGGSVGAKALALFRSSAPATPHAQIRYEYLRHLDGLKGSIDALIVANELVVDNLVALEDVLYTIHDHAVADEVELTHAARAVKASLLQRFLPLLDSSGSQRLSGLKASLETLDALRTARDVAARLFSGSLLQLRELSRELEDLRVRIVEHEVTVEQQDVASLEYQVRTIRDSLENMQQGKKRAALAREEYHRDLQKQVDENFHQYGDVVGGFYGRISEALVDLAWAEDDGADNDHDGMKSK